MSRKTPEEIALSHLEAREHHGSWTTGEWGIWEQVRLAEVVTSSHPASGQRLADAIKAPGTTSEAFLLSSGQVLRTSEARGRPWERLGI